MKNAIHWFEIYVSDFKRAKRFYMEVFKYQLKDIPANSDRHRQMEYAVFPNNENKEGASGALVRMDEAKPGTGGTLVYFATEEINKELSRVEINGGKVIRSKLHVDNFGFIALIEDKEGNMIGLHSMQ